MRIKILQEDKKVVDICSRYWEIGDDGSFLWKVADIAKDFSVSSHEIQKVVKACSIAYSNHVNCVSCDKPYIYKSRQSYSAENPSKEWLCANCAEKKKEFEVAEKRNLIVRELEAKKATPCTLESLGIRYAVFLLALVRYSANENLSYLDEFASNRTEPFSPDYAYSLQILRELYQSGAIAISPLSDLGAIEVTGDGKLKFFLDRVKWEIVLEKGVSESYFIQQLEEKILSMEFVESSYDDVVALCKEISLKECLSYLNHVLAEHKLLFEPGDKTNLVLGKALENFSVSQVYNFIWRSGKDAAAFYLRSAISKRHAANTVVSNIDKQVERALANNWDITAFRRNYNMPQSMVSRVLFNNLLHTDDGGFSQPLCKVI